MTRTNAISLNNIGIVKNRCPEISTCLFLFYNSLGLCLGWITQGLTGQVTNLFLSALRLVAFLVLTIALITKRRLFRADMLFIPLGFAVLYLLSLFNSNTAYEIGRQGLIAGTFIGAFPIYLAVRLSRQYDYLWDLCRKFAAISFMLHFFAFLIIDIGSRDRYRTFSNGMLIVASVFIIEWLYNDKRLYSLLSLFCVLMIASCGRRSSLIALLFILIIICVLKKNYKIIVVGTIVVVVIYFFWTPAGNLLSQVFVHFGVRPRILRKIIAGNITDDSHRFEQWLYVFELLFSSAKNTLVGLGIAGERSYMLNHFSHMVLQGYPHGIHIEIIGHYGIIIGTVIEVLIFIIYPMRFIDRFKEKTNLMNIFLLSLALFIPLFFQDSYIQSRSFFFYLGILMTYKIYKKDPNSTIQSNFKRNNSPFYGMHRGAS